MNSETPPIPESDNTAFEPVEASNPAQVDRPETETETAETTNFTEDVWSSKKKEASPETSPETSEPIVFEADLTPETLKADLATTPTELPDTAEDHAESNTEGDRNAASPQIEPLAETEPKLFVDTWLDETKEAPPDDTAATLNGDLNQLEQQKTALQHEVTELQARKEQLLSERRKAQENMGRLIEEGTQELKERKATLRMEIDKLERRKERIEREMRSNFAGSSKELAIRVQGFKEYLVGSLQDLATAAEKLELARTDAAPRRERPDRERLTERDNPRSGDRSSRNRERPDRERSRDRDSGRSRERNRRPSEDRARGSSGRGERTQFSEPTFADHSRRIRQLLDKYCNSPDYYGAPWQLRRTFDQTQAKKVQEWFFTQGGRGAIDSTGSRLQNILVASATISILHDIYRDRTQVLVLTDTPENLGEWRKGLEDCLGISRRDFGANRGIVLFDSPEVLVQRAERLLADKLLPIIIIDETEELLNLSVLKFPIWLAFASTNKPSSANYLY